MGTERGSPSRVYHVDADREDSWWLPLVTPPRWRALVWVAQLASAPDVTRTSITDLEHCRDPRDRSDQWTASMFARDQPG